MEKEKNPSCPGLLFVDNNISILRIFQRTLNGIFDLDTTTSVEEALELIKINKYSVVISGMNMPGKNGIDFLSEVEKNAPETIRVLLTGNPDLEPAIKAVQKGILHKLLTKPIRKKKLINIILECMEK